MAEMANLRASATAMGPWPGSDPAEANRIIRGGELGDPPPSFPARVA